MRNMQTRCAFQFCSFVCFVLACGLFLVFCGRTYGMKSAEELLPLLTIMYA